MPCCGSPNASTAVATQPRPQPRPRRRSSISAAYRSDLVTTKPKPVKPIKRPDNVIVAEREVALNAIWNQMTTAHTPTLSLTDLSASLGEWFAQHFIEELMFEFIDDEVTLDQFITAVLALKSRSQKTKSRRASQMRRLSSSSNSLVDPVRSTRRARELLGVSVWGLQHCLAKLCAERGLPLDEHRVLELADTDRESDTPTRRPTVNDVSRALRDLTSINACSRDGFVGCALVDVPIFAEHLGAANLMLVFQRGDAVEDIVGALEYWCGSIAASQNTFVWLDFMCLNLHRQTEAVPPQVLSNTVHERVRDIGQMALLLTPWDHPYQLKRGWPLYEAFVAACILRPEAFWVLLPPEESMSLSRRISAEVKTEEDKTELRLKTAHLESAVAEAEAMSKWRDTADLKLKQGDCARELYYLEQKEMHLVAQSVQAIIDGIDIASSVTELGTDKKALEADIVTRTTVAAANVTVAGQILHGLAHAGILTAEIVAAVTVGGGTYEGARNGLGEPWGAGTMTFPDGTQLEGLWDKWQLSGAGTKRCPNGDQCEGEWNLGTMKTSLEPTVGGFLSDQLACPASLPVRPSLAEQRPTKRNSLAEHLVQAERAVGVISPPESPSSDRPQNNEFYE